MKILILGGTGAMGVQMVEILKNTDNEVYVTSRKSHNDDGNIKYIKGNAHDNEFISELFKEIKFDVVVDFMTYKTEEFEKRVDLLLENAKQYFFLSSSRVYASSDTALTEESPRLLDTVKDEEYLKTDEYALKKARQENLLKESQHSNWVIIRPYITYEDNRLQLGVLEKEGWLQRALQGKPIVFSKDIASKYTTMTWAGDVSAIMVRLFGKDVGGNIYHITGEESLLWSDVLNLYLDVIEKKTGKRPEVYMTDNALNMKVSRAKCIYDRLYDRRFDNSKINEAIGENYNFVSIRDGLGKSLENFLDGERKFKKMTLTGEAANDRLCGVRGKRSDFNSTQAYIKYLFHRYIK